LFAAIGSPAGANSKYTQTFSKAGGSGAQVAQDTSANVVEPQPATSAPLPSGNAMPLSGAIGGAAPSQTNAGPASTFTLYEDFEQDWTSYWTLDDTSSTDGGEYLWGQRTCYVYQGKFAAFSVGGGAKGSSRGCSSNYPVNAHSTAVFGPIDLSSYVNGNLVYHLTGKSEYNGVTASCTSADDTVFVGIGTNPDITTHYGYISCGDFSDKQYVNTLDLSKVPLNIFGPQGVYLSMQFDSDGDSNRGFGFAVDYLSLVLTKPDPAPETKIYVPMSRKYTAPAVKGCPDNEPNSVKTQGSVITQFGVACKGTLPPGDASDFYAVDVSANRKLIVDLNNFGKNDYDVYLYNANSDTPIAQSALNPGLPEHLEFTSSSSQRLYIWVVARDPYISPYSYYLTVQR
jgi:hypothetical protein